MNIWEAINQISFSKTLLIGIFIAGLYYFIGYNDGSGLLAQIEANKKEIENTEKEIKDENDKIERINQYKKASAALGESFKKFLAYIPEKLKPIDLMKTVSIEAKAAGTNIVRLTEQGAGTRSEFYEEIKVNIDLIATFQQLMLFMSFLTKADQIITLSRLNISNPDTRTDGESPLLAIQVDLHGYRYLSVEEMRKPQ